MANDYYLQLVRQKPIQYKSLIFYPVEFCYICDKIGLDTFDKLLMPFLITKECVETGEENTVHEVDLFTDVILKEDSLLLSFSMILQLYCKCEEVFRKNDTLILKFIDESEFTICSEDYDEICNIVMKMNGKHKLVVEKPPANMSDRQREVWEKLQEGRRKDRDKNTAHIYDILNICEFGGNYRIPMSEIEHWTLWKIINCYKARVDMKVYDDSLNICLVSGDGKSVSGNNNWHQKLLLRD